MALWAGCYGVPPPDPAGDRQRTGSAVEPIRFFIVMRKETIRLTYEICVQQMEAWQALGRNYTAVQKPGYQGPEGYRPACVIFHSLDLVNVCTGIRIRVTEGCSELYVEFPPSGRYTNDYSYRVDAVPVQPFKKERVKAWKEFIDAMQTPRPMERMHEVYDYNF
jgi:hypothetical protein